MNSKDKGSRIERELANWMKERGAPSARRTQQYNGIGESDVVADELSKFHLESKGTKSPVLPRATLIKWAEQLKTDCPAHQLPVLFNKANMHPFVGLLLFEVFESLFSKSNFACVPIYGDSFNAVEWVKNLNTAQRLVQKFDTDAPPSVATYEVEPGVIFIAFDAERLLQQMLYWNQIDDKLSA